MDQLESIIQKMIDAGEDEESIASVIKEYPSTKLSLSEQNKKSVSEPTSFGEGFKKSLSSGEALNTGLRGLKGYATGAIADLPSSMMNGIKNIGNAIVNPSEAAFNTGNALMNAPQNIINTTMQSGSKPEEFGRMMGQATGQPLAAAGLTKALPYMPQMAVSGLNKIGKPLETAGHVISREGLASGFLPPITTPRYLKMTERLAGRGIKNIGQKMQSMELGKSFSPESIKSKIFRTSEPNVISKSVADEPTNKLKVRYANGKFINTETGEEILALGVKNEFTPWKGAKDIANKLLPEKSNIQSTTIKPEVSVKPQFNPKNQVGKTGNIQRTIDNAPPNQRARMFRGAHDPVEIFFENPNDREVFGGGQSLFSKGESKPGGFERLKFVTDKIANKYNIQPQKAQKLVRGYNEHIRELGKSQPKIGDNLNFTAPSFETFMNSYWR